MKKIYLFTLFLFLAFDFSIGGGIKGLVKDKEGNTLPFTTIYIEQTNFGTTSNQDGYYKIDLSEGNYEILFRYVGYESKAINVTIGAEYSNQDIILTSQTLTLEEVEVSGKEDPAYTIMRKAIAKADFHKLQAESYDCQVYIKGSGRLIKAPFFARKQLAKEGIDSTNVYTSESVSKIHFEQPDILEETVVSVRTSGEDAPMNPNLYFFTSFYEPKVSEAVSPLSPRAFAYYKFEYIGIFEDQGVFVNEIKVIPRVRGENIFAGKLFIVNDDWSIHSLDLKTRVFGIDIGINQVYTEMLDKIWMPVSHKLNVFGKALGFSGEYQYLAVISDYDIQLNPNLIGDVNLIDEKIEEIDQNSAADLSGDLDEDVANIFRTDKEVSRKQFRKMMKEIEKEELEQAEEPDVVSQRSFAVDSLAKKYDSTYWQTVRPVPLTNLEMLGYQRDDSLYVVEQTAEELDSLGKRGGSFRPLDLLNGNVYKLSEKGRFRLMPMWTQSGYNTVDGWNIGLTGNYSIEQDTVNRLRIAPEIRYAISREKFNWRMRAGRNLGEGLRGFLEIGDMVEQYNDDRPVETLINTFYSVLSRKNYAKLYERDYLNLKLATRNEKKFGGHLGFNWAQRRELSNTSNWSLKKETDSRQFTSNLPENIELADVSFDENKSSEVEVGFTIKPWLKFRKFNGVSQVISESRASFGLNFKTGIKGFLGGDTDFSQLEGSFKHTFGLSPNIKVDLNVLAGKFLNTSQMYFKDFKHFEGNLTGLTAADPVSSYRLLDYYNYSTKDEYLSGHLQLQFRKLLLTQILEVRFMGVKENVFLNYLSTPELGNYYEVGYGLDNILRFFRAEFATSFTNGDYQNNGFRFGISTFIGRNVQVNVE